MRERAARMGLLGAWLLLLALAALPCRAGQPTRTTITMNGSFDDWQTVFANPLNLVVDGDGSSVACSSSLDRDCIVSSAGADIGRFAITWDSVKLYLYVERLAPANNRSFYLYVDTGHDGRMDSNDLVLEHQFRAAQNQIVATKWAYQPGLPGGDPTEDALAFGDGYSIPGSGAGPLSDPGDPTGCAICTSGDGLAFEFAWPWSSLGITEDQAIIYHLASGSSLSPTMEDNAGGPGDGRGSNRFVRHLMLSPRSESVGPSEVLYLPHTLLNLGNWTDTLNLRAVSSLGIRVCLYDDPDNDGLPNGLMGCDRQGNGSWDDNGDFVDTSFDSDGDGAPDTGSLAPKGRFHFVAEITPDNKHNKKIERLRVVGTSVTDPLVTPLVEDEIAIGYVTIIPSHELRSVAGTTFYMGHAVVNHLPTNDLFNLAWTSSEGWSYRLFSDPDEDGFPFDGVELFDSDGDTAPDVQLPAGGLFPISIEGTAPVGTPVGTVDAFELSARSSGNVVGLVGDEVLISRSVELQPDHTVANGLAKSGSANYPTFFRHFLTWNGATPAQFDLSAVSTLGYPVDFFTDPNQDGNPADGVLLRSRTSPLLLPFGDTWNFLVRVSVPPGAAPGTVETTDVYAMHQGNPLVFDMVTDETKVTQIQTFSDAGHTVAISHSPVCADIYARTTGLAPSLAGAYRIVWDDPGSQRQQTTPVTPNALGEAEDSYVVSAAAALGAWSIAIQEFDGANWNDLDRSVLEVENEGIMDALFTDSQTYSVAESYLTATAIFRNNGVADLGPLDIEFRILNGAEDLYLKSSGEFRAFNGSETTWELMNLRLLPGEALKEIFSIVDFQWPGTGIYYLDGLWKNACGETVAVTRRTFFVTDDQDGDGLTDDVEAAAGLDWSDRDTDDDGILDGFEGLADSDGDTVPDALSCDSDGDGIFDSVESGLLLAGLDPDTDTASGCFREDADGGASTTSRTRADSDGGGVNDGEEDLNRNGAVDAGEKDPGAAWDDACAVSPPGEAGGLRVMRSGGALLLTWASQRNEDACVTYRVWRAAGVRSPLAAFVPVAEGIGTPAHADSGTQGPQSYLVQAYGPFSGDGPLGYVGP